MSTYTSSFQCKSATCPTSGIAVTEFAPVSRYAYQRYVRRSHFHFSPQRGIRVYWLPCGCYMWVHSSGERYLSPLPF
ncbi:MAG: hypothetical protein IPP37_14980 [Saprospiraceae bacterium]|nr:hypothetical protein [Saprospiraceae bacterium]